jgi:hypothetical protein
MAATLAANAEAASIDPVAVSADPTQSAPVTITVSGTSEASRSLWVYRQTSSAGCAQTAYADSTSGYASTLSASYGDSVGIGSFSKSYTFTPSDAGTLRICAYVAQYSSDTPLATLDATVDIRAAASINLDVPSYLTGDSFTLSATGETVRAASFAYSVDPKVSNCSGPSGLVSTPLAAGVFSQPINVTFTSSDVHTICAYVFDSSGVLAVKRAVAYKRPLETPSQGPVTVKAARPTFTWTSASSGTDRLVLSQGGSAFWYVTSAGGIDPSEFNADTQTASRGAKFEPSYGRITRRSDGTSVARLGFPLAPGRYAWRVIRTRDANERTTSPLKAFIVSGPPLTHLSASAQAHPGHTSIEPGYTTLWIRTTPYVTVRLTLLGRGPAAHFVWHWSGDGVGSKQIDWTCRPGSTSTYHYSVVAEDDHGRTRHLSGAFNVVSRARCASMQASERRARELARAAARRRAEAAAARAAAEQRAEAARAAAEQRAAHERFVHNCLALGGTPVTIERSDGPETMCRAPYGGYLMVPS